METKLDNNEMSTKELDNNGQLPKGLLTVEEIEGEINVPDGDGDCEKCSHKFICESLAGDINCGSATSLYKEFLSDYTREYALALEKALADNKKLEDKVEYSIKQANMIDMHCSTEACVVCGEKCINCNAHYCVKDIIKKLTPPKETKED